MLDSPTVHTNGVPRQRVRDAELLRESGVHKLVIADRHGNCLAFVLELRHLMPSPNGWLNTASEHSSASGPSPSEAGSAAAARADQVTGSAT